LKSITLKQTKTKTQPNTDSKKMMDYDYLNLKFYRALGKMLSTQTEFEQLTLIDIETLDHKSVDKFAESLGQCTSLKHIQINNCNIDGIVMSTFAKGFKMSNLTCLNLSDNQLTDDSIEAINSLLAWHYAQRDSERYFDSIRTVESDFHYK